MRFRWAEAFSLVFAFEKRSPRLLHGLAGLSTEWRDAAGWSVARRRKVSARFFKTSMKGVCRRQRAATISIHSKSSAPLRIEFTRSV
jgi:hypothetical protein